MGKALVALDFTVEGRPEEEDLIPAVSLVPAEVLERVGATMATLLRGAGQYLAVVGDEHPHALHRQIRDELHYYIVAGPAGDPFDGFSDLSAFLDACADNYELRYVACFVGWGVLAETARDADVLTMVATAMASEGVPVWTSTYVVNRVAKSLGMNVPN